MKAVARLFADMGDAYVELIATGMLQCLQPSPDMHAFIYRMLQGGCYEWSMSLNLSVDIIRITWIFIFMS